jgi:hypothetical protein
MSGNNTRMTIDELRCDPDSPVDRDDLVIREENNDNWQFGKDLKEIEKEFPWEFDSQDPADEGPKEPDFPVYICSRDSAIARDSNGEPIPYKNGTNDDLPDINVFIKTLSLQRLNEHFHINHALTMEDFIELEKYSYKTQLSLFDSVSYSRHCHQCGDEMGENRYKEIYCCDDCEIAVEVYQRECITVKLSKMQGESKNECKICSRKGNFAFYMRYGVTLSEIRIQNVRKFAQERRIKMSDAIVRYAELNDCGKDCKLCYSSNV